MASFIVEGGHRLQGTITPAGAKNEALQVLCAALLTHEQVVIDNLPDILDVNNLLALMKATGVSVSRQGRQCTLQAGHIDTAYLDSREFLASCNRLRGSVMLIGPLLARLGKVTYSKPGGDKIGRRRLDTHFQGILALGAEYTYHPDLQAYVFTAPKGLNGTYMLLEEASVTGTANIIMAAVLAKGTTYFKFYHSR